MTETNINVAGDWSKPVTELVKKLADLTGGAFRPMQIKRVAKAESDAAIIAATADVRISELQERALRRLVTEEGKRQANMESIAEKSFNGIADEARPGDVSDDWYTKFFENCRSISDETMQGVWANILAGEVNSPGAFSRKTVNLVADLDANDAMDFQRICRFVWLLPEPTPLILDVESSIYSAIGLGFDDLLHLESLGLISTSSSGFHSNCRQSQTFASYANRLLAITFIDDSRRELGLGHAMLTRAGFELFRITDHEPVVGFFEFVKQHWAERSSIASVIEAAD